MNEKITVILGSHDHVPYGAEDGEFERAYHDRIKPFITTLNQYPKIPAVLHYSGVLLHWIERAYPAFFMLIADMVSRKQVELLGGGFYEPMMSLLPLEDKKGQIEMLTMYLRKQFGKRPQGYWLPALAWDPHIIGALNTCGMGYTFLDESQFTAAGLSGAGLYRACISEDQGKLITIFPLAGKMGRGLARAGGSGGLEAFFAALPAGKDRVVSLFPPAFPGGEEEKAAEIRSFFDGLSRLEESGAPLEFSVPGRVFKSLKNLDKVYFPCSTECRSEEENTGTGESLPPPRHFLVRYPEANGLYSKMVFVNVLIKEIRGDKERKRTAREELWKAQGFDAFCHAGDGGIYRGDVRSAAYRSLLGAEKLSREKGVFIPSLMTFDFNLDGREEYLFQDKIINCYVGAEGASVFEFDYLPNAWNYLSTLARRREPYILSPAVEDPGRRNAFSDHIAPVDFSLEDALKGDFSRCRFCGGEKFELLDMDRSKLKARFRLGQAQSAFFGSLEMEKGYLLKKDTLTVRYVLRNPGEKREDFALIPEIDLVLPGEDPLSQRILEIRDGTKTAIADIPAALVDAEALEVQDIKNEAIISLSSDAPFEAWLLPIRTRCRIGGLITDSYQSTCIMPRKVFSLASGEECQTEFKLRIYH